MRRNKKESQQNSVYKRLSAHLTLDLPDLPDLSGVVRETTNRVEHMMSSSSSTKQNPNNSGNNNNKMIIGSSSGGSGISSGNELQRSHTTI